MIRVLVADDHPVVRKGLVQIISDSMDLEVRGEASSAAEVFDRVREEDFDVVVLDLDLGEASGLDVLQSLQAESPDLAVLILSVHPEEVYAVRLLRAGAAGYVGKDAAPRQLVKAIRKVAEGRRYISEAVAEQLVERMDDDTDGLPHERLSDREFQVLKLLSSGNTVSEIAESLALSVKTVSTYRTRVLEKMEMNTNAELTHYAIRNGLVL